MATPPLSSYLISSTALTNTTNIIVLLAGIGPLAIGVAALFRPGLALKFFNFPPPSATNAQDAKVTNALLRIFAIRDIAIGFTTLALWYFAGATVEGKKALGCTMFAAAGMTLGDGFASKQVTGEGLRKHWMSTPIAIGLGAVFMGWV